MVIGGYNEIKDNQVIRKRVSMPGLHIYKNEDTLHFFEKLLLYINLYIFLLIINIVYV